MHKNIFFHFFFFVEDGHESEIDATDQQIEESSSKNSSSLHTTSQEVKY